MYYTVRHKTRVGHHKETDQQDRVVLDPRQATQFPTWLTATARALELMKTSGELLCVEVHDWTGGVE